MVDQGRGPRRKALDLDQLQWDPSSLLALGPGDETLRKLEMLRLYRGGYSASEIAAAFGCSSADVHHLRERFEQGGVRALIGAPEEGQPVSSPVAPVSERLAWRSTEFHDAEWAAFAARGGTWFGLIFSLAFALLAWAPYVVGLWRHAMAMPWAEIVAGLILVGIVWALAGYLGARADSSGWAVLAGAIAGAVTPWAIWLAKVLDENLPWLVNRRLWGAPVIHMGDALRVRMLFVGFWGIGLGAFAGVLERMLLPRAWDIVSSRGRSTWRSLVPFLFCLPVALLFGTLTDDLLQRGFREEVAATYQTLSSASSVQPGQPFLTWRYGGKRVESHSSRAWPVGEFRVHLVDYDPDSMGQFFLDAVYRDGLTVRCLGGIGSSQLCGNASDMFEQQMEALIQRSLDGELASRECEMCDPYIGPRVIASLSRLGLRFTEEYQISKVAQRGGRVLMAARFGSGYELVCRFRDEAPVRVEDCFEGPAF